MKDLSKENKAKISDGVGFTSNTGQLLVFVHAGYKCLGKVLHFAEAEARD